MGNEVFITGARIAEPGNGQVRPRREGVALPFKRYMFVDRESLPGARVTIALHQTRTLFGTVADYQTPHAHDSDEYHFFIGDRRDLSGLEGQIKFEGKAHSVCSPAAVYIPANTVHECKVTKGKGSVIVLLRNPEYSHIRSEPDRRQGERNAETFAGYILRSDVRPTSELRFHHDTAPGDRHVMVDAKKLPRADFYTIVRNAYDVQAAQAHYVDPHRHNCDTYHLFIGNNDDLSGLRAEMVIENRKSVVKSPAAVYVPPGISHYYRLVGGSGKFFNIVPRGIYNESLI